MEIRNFQELIDKVKESPSKKRMVIAAAGEEHTLQAALHARKEGIVRPILVGDKIEIDRILNKLGESVPDEDIYDV